MQVRRELWVQSGQGPGVGGPNNLAMRDMHSRTN
jgi:hypothetical protein